MPLASCPSHGSCVGGGLVTAAFNIIQLADIAAPIDVAALSSREPVVEDRPDKPTMFWGVEVTSQSPLTLTTERSLRISKAVLVSPSDDQHSFAVELFLKAEPNGTPVQISRFLPNVAESSLDLHLGKGDSVTFILQPGGHVAVHLSGYHTDEQETAKAERLVRVDTRMDHLVDICNRILERTYHIN